MNHAHMETLKPIMQETNRVFPMIYSVYEERATKSWQDVFNKRIDQVFTVSSHFSDDVEAYWISLALLHDNDKYGSSFDSRNRSI